MIDLEKFTQVKRTVEKYQSEKDKAIGGLEQLKKEIKEQHDVDSIKEAKELLASLKEGLADAEEEYEEKLTKLEEEFPGIFNSGSSEQRSE